PLNSSQKERNKIKEYYYFVLDLILNNPNKLFVLDRFIWSEMAYSFKRGYEAIDDVDLVEMENQISKIPHLVIHLSPLEEIIRYRLERDGDEHINQNDISELMHRYEIIFEHSPLNKIQVDSSQESSVMLKIIKNYLNKNEHHRDKKRGLEQLKFNF
ncbi:MAG: hypothetical protein AABY22_34890, partial [Nanoarchaeota archaeon]